MNYTQNQAFIATYNGVMRHIDISDKSNPKVIQEYKPSFGLCYAFHWHPNEKILITCGAATHLEVFDIESKKTTKKYGHDAGAIPWVYWVDEGKRLLSTDSNESILWNCPDPALPDGWT